MHSTFSHVPCNRPQGRVYSFHFFLLASAILLRTESNATQTSAYQRVPALRLLERHCAPPSGRLFYPLSSATWRSVSGPIARRVRRYGSTIGKGLGPPLYRQAARYPARSRVLHVNCGSVPPSP